MKQEWKDEIEAIGDDSWELQAATELRSNASKASIVQALKADAKWMEHHMLEVQKRIDALIQEIEYGGAE